MKKYYTPDISEFHVGFEYELHDWWTISGIDPVTKLALNDGFIKQTLTSQELFEWPIRSKEELMELQKTSEGPVGNPGCDYQHVWTVITDGIKAGRIRVKRLDDDDMRSIGFKNENENTWRSSNSDTLLFRHGTSNLIIWDRHDDRVFSGKVKNLSELKRILSMVADPEQQPAVSGSLPPDVMVDDLARIRNYFGDNDRTPFEHHAYTIMNKLLQFATVHSGNGA